MFNFEKLDVYQLSKELSIELIKEANKFPFQYSRIRDQLLGAAISIPLNIAEGAGRLSKKDKTNFYRTAKSSDYELYSIIDICDSLKLLNKVIYYDKIERIAKMLTRLIQSQK